MMQIRENRVEQVCIESGGQSTIEKQRGWKEKSYSIIDWHFANRRWRKRNGKYSNSYGGT